MSYLSIKNWEKFQHYKDRSPPWIKLHRELLDDYEFSRLQDASKAHLILLWLLASQLENKIPNDPAWLKNRLGLTTEINLKELISKGFLICYQDASNAQAKRSSETEDIEQTEKELPPVSPKGENDAEVLNFKSAKPPRRARGEKLETFMAREFPDNPAGCPQEWGEAAVAAANEYRPQTKTDFTKIVNWHFDKFFNHFTASTKSNALKSDWRKAWMNWWKTEFEKIAKQEERDEFYAQKRA